MPKNHIVIVGNGARLQGSGLGDIIDSHNIVVRLNRWFLHGFDADVGERIDLHIHSHGIDPFPPDIPHFEITSRPTALDAPPRLPFASARAAREFVGLPLEGDLWPSTGFHAISHFLVTSDWETPLSICGFDSGKTGHYWNPAHQHGICHPWEQEAKYLEVLKETNQVVQLD